MQRTEKLPVSRVRENRTHGLIPRIVATVTGGQQTESSLRSLLLTNWFEELKEQVKPDSAADYSPNPSTARAV